ncbi:MAG: Uma2 family endonuclease [Vulcanimicrobiota bacterium]
MKTLYTGEDFARLPLEGPYELVRGELRALTPPGFEHGEIASNVAFVLKSFTRRVGWGRVTVESGFYTRRAPDSVRGPDVALWADREGSPTGFSLTPPLVAVEVVSPKDASEEVEEKVQEYLAAGVLRVWILYPRTQTMHVYAPEGVCQVYGIDSAVEVDPLLPGFACQLGEFFGQL